VSSTNSGPHFQAGPGRPRLGGSACSWGTRRHTLNAKPLRKPLGRFFVWRHGNPSSFWKGSAGQLFNGDCPSQPYGWPREHQPREHQRKSGASSSNNNSSSSSSNSFIGLLDSEDEEDEYDEYSTVDTEAEEEAEDTEVSFLIRARSAARLSSQTRAGNEGNKNERMIARSLQRGNASNSTIAAAIQGLAAGPQQSTATAAWEAEAQNVQTTSSIGGMNEEEKEAQLFMLKRKYMPATAEETDSKKPKLRAIPDVLRTYVISTAVQALESCPPHGFHNPPSYIESKKKKRDEHFPSLRARFFQRNWLRHVPLRMLKLKPRAQSIECLCLV
jgi:hypothetical protein